MKIIKKTTTRKIVPVEQPKNGTGIWIDTMDAMIIELGDKTPVIKRVQVDKDEHARILTGKNTGSRFGKGFISQEGKEQVKLDRERSEFLKNVIKEIGTTDELVVFGPAQTKFELAKQLASTPRWRKKAVAVETTDNMTKNQKVAWVKKFFKPSSN